MSLDRAFTLAHDSEFRTLVSFSSPPRPGRVIALEASGQVRVEMDDPDGGDALAWPLNGATYAVDDIVYCLFAANAPDSAIVVGAKGSSPAYAPLRASEVRAASAGGLRLSDQLGNLGVVVADGGRVGVGGAAEATRQLAIKSTGQASMLMQTTDDTAQSFAAAVVMTNGGDVDADLIAHDTLRVAVRSGITLGGWAELLANGAGLAGLLIDTFTSAPIVFGTANVERMRITSDGSLGVGTTQFGSGVRVIGIANATTVPSTNPSGGGVIYCQNGRLMYRGSSGTVTQLAPA